MYVPLPSYYILKPLFILVFRLLLRVKHLPLKVIIIPVLRVVKSFSQTDYEKYNYKFQFMKGQRADQSFIKSSEK